MSNFEKLFTARNEKPPEKKTPSKRQGSSPKKSPTPPSRVKPSVEVKTVAKSGEDSGYEQTLVYLKSETKREVKKRLLDDPRRRDFSDLVEELLSDWIAKN